MSKAIVGAYWGARKETRQACAERLQDFFDALRRADPHLGRWFRRMMKQTDPVVPMPTSAAELVHNLRENLDDSTPRKVIEELGFSFGAWNGFDAPAPASFVLTVGAYSDHSDAVNGLVLTCDDQTTSHDLLQVYLKAVADAFEPEDAIAHDNTTLKAAHARIKASRITPPQLTITDPPAVFRYKRGRGFSWDADSGLPV